MKTLRLSFVTQTAHSSGVKGYMPVNTNNNKTTMMSKLRAKNKLRIHDN